MSKLSLVGNLIGSAARVAGRRVTGHKARPDWSFKYEVFADALKRSERAIRQLPTAEQGSAWERRAIPHPILNEVRVEPVTAGGVPAEWITPRDLSPSDARDVLLYLHGGWYCTASPRNYRELLARFATQARMRVLALDYRLAPAHPFPAAVDDAMAGWRWLCESFTPDRMLVGGDSAGGGLATALMLSLRDAGERLPAGGILLCPWVDLSATGGSLVTNAAFDWSDPDIVAERARQYLGEADPMTPLASPVFGELRGLPPLLVQVGGAEMLLDQVLRFGQRVTDAGVDVSVQVMPDMIHDWQLFAALFEQSRTAIAAAATFARGRLPRVGSGV